MKKCPPGVFCIQNISIVLIILFFFIFIYLFKPQNFIINNKSVTETKTSSYPSYPNLSYPNIIGYPDVLLNPYTPPLRDERINVSTNIGAVETTYRQMGILTPLNGKSKDNILPLMGRPLYTNRNLWNYYTTSNQYNNVKLPISFKGKSGTNEYGVDEIYNNDTVYIEGINEPYKTTIYDNATIRYLS
jgi:hypothetical protein